ncbi:hypothetical protein ABW20_dc0103005 [Dactylellina cionopaga]|nr:hypothetical protein ABW20_dc0103005 [Dactylellina cionopaga]
MGKKSKGQEQEPFIPKDDSSSEKPHDTPQKQSVNPHPKPLPIAVTIIITAIASSIFTLMFPFIYRVMLQPPQDLQHFILPHSNISALGTVTKTFSDEAVYLNRSTEAGRKASEKAWKDLIPNGRGFVSISKLTKDSKYDIPISLLELDTSNKGQFAVSAFHQLHCLHMVVSSYFAALGSHDHDVVHTKHCLEYLRNSVICAADSALEPWKKDLNGVDGFRSPHMCRNFEGLFKWAEEYRATNV